MDLASAAPGHVVMLGQVCVNLGARNGQSRHGSAQKIHLRACFSERTVLVICLSRPLPGCSASLMSVCACAPYRALGFPDFGPCLLIRRMTVVRRKFKLRSVPWTDVNFYP
jgi:hypothetical protein